MPIPHYSGKDELRILAIAAPALLPTLETQKQGVLDRIYSAYRSGATEYRHLIAEYVTLRDLIEELTTKIEQHEQGGN